MEEETRRYDSNHGTIIAVKRELLGNTYLVVVHPRRQGRSTKLVVVYADSVTGEDHGFPDSIQFVDSQTQYDKIIYKKFSIKADESAEIAKAVNEAVRSLEASIESDNSTEDAVLGALEANAEVHDENI